MDFELFQGFVGYIATALLFFAVGFGLANWAWENGVFNGKK